jgi:hypothetical protein
MDSDPVLRRSVNQWDEDFVDHGTVMLEGDSLRMWYAGTRIPVLTYLWRIGHATAPFDSLVGIQADDDSYIPEDYSLSQNYPNPFNPSTHIGFRIADFGFVTLTIYNVAGEKVATLVSENLSAGSYEYQWDPRGLASGVYFYRLETDRGFTQTKKMLLIR